MHKLFKKTSIFLFIIVYSISTQVFSQEIFKAIMNKDISNIKFILYSDKNAVNIKKGNGNTALHIAADNGYYDIAKLLISSGADLDNKNNGNRSPLFYAMRSGHLDIVHVLVDNGAEITLGEAATCGFIDLIKQHITEGVDLNDNDLGVPLLHSATFGGQKEITELLIENGANINLIENNSGFTPIFYAIINNHEDVIDLLIKNGAELNVTDNKGDSPLDIAKAIGNDKVIKKLIVLGAKSTLGPEANIHKLAENIFVINFSYQNKPNIISLIGQTGSLLIDTGFGRNAERLSLTINELGNKKLKYIINTHLHGDHTGGNFFFTDSVEVINLNNLNNFVSEGIINNIYEESTPYLNGNFASYFSMNFESENLILIPAPGTHTITDMIIWLKRSNIVLLGDILLPGYFQKESESLEEYINRRKNTILSKGVYHLTIIDNMIKTFHETTIFVGGHGNVFTMETIKNYYDIAKYLVYR